MTPLSLPILSETFDDPAYRLGLATGRLNTLKELAEVMVVLGASVESVPEDQQDGFRQLARAWSQIGVWAIEAAQEAAQELVLLSDGLSGRASSNP